ncbi:MAG TPA: glycosyltransferase family 2 protein [Solirubrobacteraceae bacterium]|jgi:cellulose synthase/poly-beta-1,6-N-acetylglucosamine synthase-like glycosyltransferase|nr:glycosyltransferase family 2 protein [Solirubrobacteraceae bacterium]
MTRAVFAAAAALVAYTYVAFPVLVILRARLRPRPHRSAPVTPSVTLVIAAHNEADSIAAKIENLRALDYPHDRLQVVIACDGCDDGTDAIARASGDDRVCVLSLSRVGKAGALNAAVAVATGEILVFSDANSIYAPDALRALVAPFADPEVGGVAGDQRYLAGGGEAAVASGERRYWDLDRVLKTAESLGGNVISATGAIYAVRRELFASVPRGVTDDFATSTAVIAQGRRLVFAPDAVAFEPVGRSGEVEFERKVRVMTRGLNAVIARRELLNPRRHGFYALQLVSHKVLRRLMAVPLMVLGLSAAVLARRSAPFRALAAVQGIVYALGTVGLLLGGRAPKRTPLLGVPAYFCLVNAASLRAVWNVVRRREIDRWEPRREA